MTAKAIPDVLTPAEIEALLAYLETDDEVTDSRPDVRSKHPAWDSDQWPRAAIRRALDSLLGEPYEVEEVIFTRTRIPFQVHVDSGDGEVDSLYQAALFPLETLGRSTTVFFANRWHGPAVKFTKAEHSPFSYAVPDLNGELFAIPDLREFRERVARNPGLADGLQLGHAPVATLDYLIEARQNRKISKVEPRVSDYSGIVGYRPGARFPEAAHGEYLRHVPIESLHGLTLESVLPWQVGGAILFDRTQIHSAGYGHRSKTCVTVFTRRKPR